MATYFVCVSVQDPSQPLMRHYDNDDVELDLKEHHAYHSVVQDIASQLGYDASQGFIVHSMQLIGD